MPQPIPAPVPQQISHAPDADLDALVPVLAGKLQDAGTALLAGMPVPAVLARAFPSFPSIVGQCRDSIAPRDRPPAPLDQQIEAAHDILALAVALIENPTMLRVIAMGSLVNPRTGLRYHSDKVLGPQFNVSPSMLASRRRAALREMAVGMCREAEASDHCYAKGEVSAHISDGPATEAPCCT